MSLIMLTGCAVELPDNFASSKRQFTSTLYITAKNKTGLIGEILSVDGVLLARGARVAALQPGIRVVAFNCPDTLTLDKSATISAEFKANQDYEIFCEGITARILAR